MSRYRTAFTLFVIATLLGVVIPLQAQTEPVATGPTSIVHNTWRTAAPLLTPVAQPAVAVLSGHIYVVGGWSNSVAIADTQIYNPVTNTWAAGVSLPTPLSGASAAVVNGILYVFGGYTGTSSYSNAVYAYSLKTKKWTSKSPMPTARCCGEAVITKNALKQRLINILGGWDGANGLTTFESYNPATDSWTEEAPLIDPLDDFAAGLVGGMIVTGDGSPGNDLFTADTEVYNATSNTWKLMTADSTARCAVCGGAIGTKLYSAGGNPDSQTATDMVSAFSPSKNAWTTGLLPMPQGTMYGSSTVYKGQLYCIGGVATFTGPAIDAMQIYQP